MSKKRPVYTAEFRRRMIEQSRRGSSLSELSRRHGCSDEAIRDRTRQSRSCFNRMTILAMVFKLAMGAQKNWRRMKGYGLLPQVELGTEFKDGFPSIPNMSPTISVEPASSTIH